MHMNNYTLQKKLFFLTLKLFQFFHLVYNNFLTKVQSEARHFNLKLSKFNVYILTGILTNFNVITGILLII